MAPNPAKKGRSKKQRSLPNVSQRPGGTTTTPARRVNPLPTQYDFTPSAAPQGPVVGQQTNSAPNVRDYPPPRQLFNTNPPPRREEDPTTSSHEVQHQPSYQSSSPTDEASPIRMSNPSREGNNFEEQDPVAPDLDEDALRSLHALLLVPDRERFTTVLSPIPTPNSTWYVNQNST